MKLSLGTAVAVTMSAFVLVACATPQTPPKIVSVPPPPPDVKAAAMQATTPTLKRKIAIGRFSNSTNYGRALLLDDQKDPLAEQASDMLSTRLINTGQFLVFERQDINVVKAEAEITGQAAQLVGVDALIVGSVTQFGRQTEGQVGFLSSTKRQTASATVEIRLVDAHSGLAFFSTTGSGSASVEAGEVAGFGSRAAYDSTLTDRAIGAAISDLTSNVIQKLQERPWMTDILDVSGNQVQISGGLRQGVKVGDEFVVETKGKTVVSGQSGLPITLPGTQVARIRIASFFGTGETEGATAQIVSGSISQAQRTSLIVKEAR
jgi:curli biogenesis system outer membrane secretion channel CsgG